MTSPSFPYAGGRLLGVGHQITRLGWPALLSCFLLLGALASLASAWFAHAQMVGVRNTTAAMQRTQQSIVRNQPASSDPLPIAPPDAQYLEDLKALFVMAKGSGIGLGVIEYKTERHDKLPLTLRSIDLKLKDDYPKVKSFLSQTLATFAHASLQEVRIERADGMALQGTLLIRLGMIYKSADGVVVGTAMPASTTK